MIYIDLNQYKLILLHYESSSIKNSSYTKTRFKNQDSESSSSTNITQHVNNNFKSKFNFIKANIPKHNLNTQFKFTKGNISEGINPKLVPINNQLTQVPSNESSSIWPSSDSDWGDMLKKLLYEKYEIICISSIGFYIKWKNSAWNE